MPRRFLLLLVPILMACAPAVAQDDDDDLEDKLIQVGKEYAIAYISPLAHGWGANQNSGLFHTAAIPRARLTFSIGLKVMGTRLNEEDQTFRRVLRNRRLSEFFDVDGDDDVYGDIVFEGPTVVGDPDATGTITGYVNGLPAYQIEAIGGLVETRWVPLVAPELQVGGVAGFRASLRWLPEVDLGDFGKTKYLGYGLQWNPGQFLPNLPVDVMIGFFKQEINLGSIIETSATSLFVAASKSFALATVYGGLATESSSMTVSYEEENLGRRVDFEIDGAMTSRLTLGTTLNLGARLNAEVGIGKLTVFTAGLMFGI